jgi:predicted phosphoadenosine phosphosulfate sulfurtransferase
MGKRFLQENVLDAARKRVAETFEIVERVYIAFSGGKDSSVMFHLVMDEARKRNVRVGVMFIDMEAQYADTIKHAKEMFQLYRDNIDHTSSNRSSSSPCYIIKISC